jgi:hypothetical protein
MRQQSQKSQPTSEKAETSIQVKKVAKKERAWRRHLKEGGEKKAKQLSTYTSQNRISVNTRETFFVLRPRLLVSAVLRLSRRQGRLLG